MQALADNTTAPLDGALPADFRVGGRRALDRLQAKQQKLEAKLLRRVDKLTRKLETFLAKTVPVGFVLRVFPGEGAPVLAFDETAALAAPPADFGFDLLVVAHEPHLLPTHRTVAAGFATAGAGDVTVERLDLAGDVADSVTTSPDGMGRWRAVLELPGPGPVVLRARQGVVGVTRTLGAP